ncbi:hypothetical protein CARUB_v10007525mg [Capsella rubella]|uniref:Uncharacterized protein n=1 Tax=Capsella rubella TaxID=81985 RepID=R0FAY3_9BRAS|nr:hypothetical protein CARUB_v10007525mg [Capsella rubella]
MNVYPAGTSPNLQASNQSSGKDTRIFRCTSSSSATIAYSSITSYFLVTGGTRLTLVIRAPHSRSSVTESKDSSAVKYLSTQSSEDVSLPELKDLRFNLDKRLLISRSDAYSP